MHPSNIIETMFNSCWDKIRRTRDKLKVVNTNNTIKWESCSSCNKLLNIKVNTNVDQRNCYIDGVGQLCKDCYNKTYNISNE